MFTKDNRTENFLNQLGVEFKYKNSLKIADLKHDWNTQNIARPVSVREEAVIEYASLMENGSPAPAPIVLRDVDAFRVLDGVQRISSAILNGLSIFNAYVVTCDSPTTISAIRVLANHRLQGRAETPEWNRRCAVEVLVAIPAWLADTFDLWWLFRRYEPFERINSMRIIKLEEHGDDCMICCDGRQVRVDCSPADARHIGLKLKVFAETDGEIELRSAFWQAFCEISDVINTSKQHISKARGQIEDAGYCTEKLSDLDIAIMDVYVREWIAEQAREVEDPFNSHERGPYAVNQTIRIDAPYLPELFEDFEIQSV